MQTKYFFMKKNSSCFVHLKFMQLNKITEGRLRQIYMTFFILCASFIDLNSLPILSDLLLKLEGECKVRWLMFKRSRFLVKYALEIYFLLFAWNLTREKDNEEWKKESLFRADGRCNHNSLYTHNKKGQKRRYSFAIKFS